MKKLLCFLVIMASLCCFVQGEDAYSWDFADCDVKDIIFAVSLDTGRSIVCDDTVGGKADFKFAGGEFDEAFEAFLNGNRLYVDKGESVWTVSRMKVERKNGLFCLDAYDLLPVVILEKLSVFVDDALTFEVLPAVKVSVHFKDLSEQALLEALALRFGSYVVQRTEIGFHFVKSVETRKVESGDGFVRIKAEENKIKIDVKNSRFGAVVEELFECEAGLKYGAESKDVADLKNATDSKVGAESKVGTESKNATDSKVGTESKNATDSKVGAGTTVCRRQFCLVSGNEAKINRICFEEEDFDKALEKLCRLSGFDFVVKENIYYVFVDSDSKDKLLWGERYWSCFNLKYAAAQEIIPFVLKRFGNVEHYAGEDKSLFFARVTETEKKQIEEMIGEMDVKKSVFVVNLKYIRPEELMKHLPPDVDKSCLLLADDNSCVYFRGTQAAYESFCEQIAVCDCMPSRLSYDLLILQYDETVQDSWSLNLGAGTISFGDRNTVSGKLGSVLNLNMNVVAAFGLEFAASLQGSIEENKTSVYADTTLHGVNGKPISFVNTSTYRYRDNNLDPETGKPVYSGVTREIISGIKIDVVPWVSGDGMITSTVTASVSRQGTDTSSSTGNPPPTTEKVITTEVCCKSGEPVILSGLIQNSLTEDEKGMPLIGKLPLFRKILNSSEKNKEKSQMVIFLVPRIEGEKQFVERNRDEEISKKIENLMKMLEEKNNELQL